MRHNHGAAGQRQNFLQNATIHRTAHRDAELDHHPHQYDGHHHGGEIGGGAALCFLHRQPGVLRIHGAHHGHRKRHQHFDRTILGQRGCAFHQPGALHHVQGDSGPIADLLCGGGIHSGHPHGALYQRPGGHRRGHPVPKDRLGDLPALRFLQRHHLHAAGGGHSEDIAGGL